MPPSPIELALSSLLPTTSPLPLELLELATSLLAQSRTRAASLKPQEEIGRTYACCHVACERLGKKLALEIGRPAPPVKPSVYEKLKSYMGSVLRAPATPRSRGLEGKALSVTPTPTKSVRVGDEGKGTLTPTRIGLVRTHARPRAGFAGTGVARRAEEFPAFMYDISRHLCQVHQSMGVHPYMDLAVNSVLGKIKETLVQTTALGKRKRTAVSEDAHDVQIELHRLPAFVIALYLCVAGRAGGETLEGDEHEMRRNNAVAIVHAFCKAHVKTLLDVPNTGDMSADVECFMDEAKRDWMQMEWYLNVPTLEATEGGADDETLDEDGQDAGIAPTKRPARTPLRRKEKHAKRHDGAEDLGAAGLLPGLGTMFQPAVDWLSDERRAEYAAWKGMIMREIAMIEQQG